MTVLETILLVTGAAWWTIVLGALVFLAVSRMWPGNRTTRGEPPWGSCDDNDTADEERRHPSRGRPPRTPSAGIPWCWNTPTGSKYGIRVMGQTDREIVARLTGEVP
jgi:hypothetical protein